MTESTLFAKFEVDSLAIEEGCRVIALLDEGLRGFFRVPHAVEESTVLHAVEPVVMALVRDPRTCLDVASVWREGAVRWARRRSFLRRQLRAYDKIRRMFGAAADRVPPPPAILREIEVCEHEARFAKFVSSCLEQRARDLRAVLDRLN